jgi:hypothetical protein
MFFAVHAGKISDKHLKASKERIIIAFLHKILATMAGQSQKLQGEAIISQNIVFKTGQVVATLFS